MTLSSIRKSRGQVLVLACVTMLIMAMMILLSFNLTQAIHEKIRVQSHADSAAYSIAVLEARGLNTLAYTNRAIAAAMVAQTALHSWMALASVQASVHDAFATAFMIVGVGEIVLCVACCIACCIQHCVDAGIAFSIMAKHMNKAREVGNKVKDLEQPFNDGVNALHEMVKALKDGEDDVVQKVLGQIASPADMLNKLKSNNAPKSSYITNVLDLNTAQFSCALEGAKNVPCNGGGAIDPSRSESDKSLRSKLMQNSANAARPSFQRSSTHPIADMRINNDFWPMSSYLKDIQNNEGTHFFMYSSTSRVSDNDSSSVNKSNELSNAAGYAESGFLFVQWRHWFGFGSPSAKILSDTSGGKHEPNEAHSDDHDKMIDCSQDDCYINFRALDDKDRDWGQPSTFAAAQQDLRLLTKPMFGSDKGPWELNSNATIEVKLTNGAPAKVRMAPEGMGIAVAKGKTYYHQMGGWQHAPNLFDPFWRAKLHPFKRDELNTVLGLAGDSNGQQTIGGGSPVEGDVR